MQLSVIIPVYNVEAYLRKCIHSLHQQDISKSEFELIVINDGSPDNSRQIILELMNVYSNIVFIDQENKGVSMARNAGIDRASGKYLMFIDPDDYVEPNSFKNAIRAADKQNADVSFLGYKFLNEDGSIKKAILYNEEKGKLYKGVDMYSISRGDGLTDPDRSVAILFNKDFINRYSIRYIAHVPYLEDGEFLARVMCLADRCILESTSFYIRTTRPGSATNSRLVNSDSAISGFVKAAFNLFSFQQFGVNDQRQRDFLNQPICKFVLLAVNSSLKSDGKIKLKEVLAELRRHEMIKCKLEGCNKYYRRDGFVFNLSPHIYAIYKPIWSVFDRIYFRIFKSHP